MLESRGDSSRSEQGEREAGLFLSGQEMSSFSLLVTVISPGRRLICGPNTIDVEITPIWKLLSKEVISPVSSLGVGWKISVVLTK